MKAGIKYFRHITITPVSVVKSITFYKFNLSAFIFVESITLKVTKIIEFFISLISKIFTSVIKSLTSHDFGLLSLFIFEKNVINDANIVIMKARIKYFTHITITIKTSLSTYRFVLFPSLTYEIATLKTCFTIADLYMRYVLSSKFQVRSKITRIIIVLFIIFI